ncbi:MAG: multidrug transporter permease, partial [Paenibacillaceae bacterium]|nr:multidrug transporter permease [Paenibacillaceae bacterium]
MSKQTEQHDISQFVPEGKLSDTIVRLARYALVYWRPLAIALLMLVVAVGTELTGPFVAKRIIDKHITGIEQDWYTTPTAGPFSVTYEGTLYKRADHFAEGEARGGEVHILQVGLNYYFINGPVAFDGERSVAGVDTVGGGGGEKQLTIVNGDRVATYGARELSLDELFGFFYPEFAGLLRLCLFYFGLVVVSAFFTYGQKYMLQTTANRIVKVIRDDIFNHLSRLAVRYFDNLPAGKVVSRITNDTETIRELYVNVLANFFTGIIYMASIFVALFLLHAKLAAICLFIVPILLAWIFLYRKFSKTYNRIIRSTVSEINGVVNESIQGMPIIKAFAKEPQIADEFETHNSKLFRFRNKILSLNSLTEHNLVGVIRNCAFVALIWYIGGAKLAGTSDAVTLGMLYAFVDYINRLFNPIVGIVNQLPKLEIALVSAERVFILLDEPGDDVADERVARFTGHVRFEDVRFGYAEGEDVLHGISFEAKPGQTVALVG